MPHYNKLIVKELSLVDKAANRETFLLYKADDLPKADPPSDGDDKPILSAEAELLASDLETLGRFTELLSKHVAMMLAKITKKKDYKYPYGYPEKTGKHMGDDHMDDEEKKKKKEEEEARAKKLSEEVDDEFARSIMEQLREIDKEVNAWTPETIIAQAQKV